MSSSYENNNSKKDNPVLGCLFFIIVIPLTLKLLAPPKTYFVCKNHICQIEYKKKFFSKSAFCRGIKYFYSVVTFNDRMP